MAEVLSHCVRHSERRLTGAEHLPIENVQYH